MKVLKIPLWVTFFHIIWKLTCLLQSLRKTTKRLYGECIKFLLSTLLTSSSGISSRWDRMHKAPVKMHQRPDVINDLCSLTLLGTQGINGNSCWWPKGHKTQAWLSDLAAALCLWGLPFHATPLTCFKERMAEMWAYIFHRCSSPVESGRKNWGR